MIKLEAFSGSLLVSITQASSEMRGLLQVGWVSTWSSYSTYKRQHPDGPDPLPAFQNELLEALANAQEDSRIELTFPIFIILGKKVAG